MVEIASPADKSQAMELGSIRCYVITTQIVVASIGGSERGAAARLSPTPPVGGRALPQATHRARSLTRVACSSPSGCLPQGREIGFPGPSDHPPGRHARDHLCSGREREAPPLLGPGSGKPNEGPPRGSARGLRTASRLLLPPLPPAHPSLTPSSPRPAILFRSVQNRPKCDASP